MMGMVMIVMMIVLLMVIIVPEALRQVDSVVQHSYQTFKQLRDLPWQNELRRKYNSSQCITSKQYFRLGRMTPSEWTRSV
jgi:predicted PurR-regulated permease PerM